MSTEKGAKRPNDVFTDGIRALEEDVPNPFERASAFFLFGSLQQFFFDGNKRTSRFMMNGALMQEGIDAISIPAVRATEFNSRMVDFYVTRDATRMMAFVMDCHPEIAQIHQLNPGLSVVKDVPQIDYYRLDDPPGSLAGENDTSPALAETRQRLGQRPSIEDIQRDAAESWRRRQHEHKPDISGSEQELASNKEHRAGVDPVGLEPDNDVD